MLSLVMLAMFMVLSHQEIRLLWWIADFHESVLSHLVCHCREFTFHEANWIFFLLPKLKWLWRIEWGYVVLMQVLGHFRCRSLVALVTWSLWFVDGVFFECYDVMAMPYSMLYESSRRKPGWRFTAGFGFCSMLYESPRRKPGWRFTASFE